MQEKIYTIPISVIFEEQDGCPICRLRARIEDHVLTYILGDAMMEPDVRLETNRLGFCTRHLDQMMARRNRLQLALMLQTHVETVHNTVLKNGFLQRESSKEKKAQRVLGTCYICQKVETTMARMTDTLYRCYETEKSFRDLLDAQPMFCLPHFQQLSAGISSKNMPHYGRQLQKRLSTVTEDCAAALQNDLTQYCRLYDYRSDTKADDEVKTAVERSVAFLSGRRKEDLP